MVRRPLIVVPLLVVLSAFLGFWTGQGWVQLLSRRLARAEITVTAANPGVYTEQALQTAVAFALAPLFAIIITRLLDRVDGQPGGMTRVWASTIPGWAGTFAGLAASFFAAARIAIPAALNQSIGETAIHVALSDLAVGGWALGGSISGSILAAFIGVVIIAARPPEEDGGGSREFAPSGDPGRTESTR